MKKGYATWQIYITDSFGAERKAGRFEAKSKEHAISLARKAGVTKVTDAVQV